MGMVQEEVKWAIIVFLTKGRGGYQGIGIVDVVWKICATVVNFWIKWSVTIHDRLHGFRAGMGMGPETLEVELEQQL